MVVIFVSNHFFGKLVINAIIYTLMGGQIEIQSEIKDNYYIISVKDNGIGITGTETKLLFKYVGKIE